MKDILLSLLALFFVAPTAAFAGADDGLYDPVAPANSAFVRLYNTTSAKVTFMTDGKERAQVSASEISPYVVQKAGDFSAAAKSLSLATTAKESGYYTFYVKGKDLIVLEDQALNNRSKALVSFYNLSSLDGLSLKTADGKVNIIADQNAGSTASREMNGVKVSMGIFKGIEAKASMTDLVLERGKAYSIIATDGVEGTLHAHIFEFTTDTKN